MTHEPRNHIVYINESGRCSYPFGELDVDEGFIFDIELRKLARCAAHAYGKRHGKVFRFHQYTNKLGRIWRQA